MALLRARPSQALMLTLLLCVLLLEAQGGYPKHKWLPKIKKCKKWPRADLCSHHCSYFQKCQEKNTCCLTFCGNVCMRL
uniref:Protein WFDC10B n=1 Tax=Sciurus vulgaris TaxID=55149 RepID=A0A8D2AHC5_SCIVU